MQADVRIGHLDTRFRIPGRASEQRAKLDRLSGQLEEPLSLALERIDLPTGGVVCVRELCCRVRARWGESDADIALQWSLALTAELSSRLAHHDSGVIPYASRFDALLDCVASAAQGDAERAWAWDQVGLGEEMDFERSLASAALRALARQPRDAAAVLANPFVTTAIAGLLSAPAVAWADLARAILRALGANLGLADSSPGEDLVQPEARHARVAAAIAKSRIAAALSSRSARQISTNALTSSLSVIVLAEVDPAVLLAPIARRLLDDVARVIDSSDSWKRTPSGLPEPSRCTGDRDAENAPRAAADTSAAPTPRTHWGGLPFLLHAIRDLDLPARWTAAAPIMPVTIGECLHRLALALLPIEPRDPAVLAFSGFDLDEEPPLADPDERVSAALDAARLEILDLLRRRLGDDCTPDESLLIRTCGRTAEVVFSGHQIEIRLRTQELDIDVRRAGLDLDPGWLPWLGRFLRFAYVD
jgi:hypothetical protein